MTPSLPEKIGKYRVLSELGRGATSRVFLADQDSADWEPLCRPYSP